MVFIITYVVLIFLGTFVNALFGLDLITSFSSSVTCIGNVGPGFGEVGSMDNFSSMPAILKLQGSLLMLMGRLEIFGFIQFLFIKWWR